MYNFEQRILTLRVIIKTRGIIKFQNELLASAETVPVFNSELKNWLNKKITKIRPRMICFHENLYLDVIRHNSKGAVSPLKSDNEIASNH